MSVTPINKAELNRLREIESTANFIVDNFIVDSLTTTTAFDTTTTLPAIVEALVKSLEPLIPPTWYRLQKHEWNRVVAGNFRVYCNSPTNREPWTTLLQVEYGEKFRTASQGWVSEVQLVREQGVRQPNFGITPNNLPSTVRILALCRSGVSVYGRIDELSFELNNKSEDILEYVWY